MTIARVTDLSFCPACCHSCPACCHSVIGPALSGSPDTEVNGLKVLRGQMADDGVHCCCCGSNTWKTQCGSDDIYVNGLPIVRNADCTIHCGGGGNIMTYSSDTNTNY